MTVCYLCGGPNNGSLGKCQNCINQLQEGTARKRVAAEHRRNSQRRNEIVFLCLGIPIFIGAAICGAIFLKASPAAIRSDSSYYYVSDKAGTSVLRYARGEFTKLEGRIFQFGDHSGSFKEGGIGFEFAYLTEASYSDFVTQYGKGGACPAPFYNANMQIVFIISDNANLLSRLRRCDFERWDKLSLNGRFLEFVDGKSPSGKIALPGGRQKYFYLTSADLKSSNC